MALWRVIWHDVVMQRQTTASYLTKRIASRLRGRVSQGNVTQVELSEVVGISQSQLSKLLRGVRVFDVDELDAVCQALGLEAGEVVATAYAEATDTWMYENLTHILDEIGDRPDSYDEYRLAAHHNDGKRREREAREDTP